MCRVIKVTVWNEFAGEKRSEQIRAVYPDGIHEAIAAFLGADADIVVRTATLDEPEHGLPQEVLDDTDTLVWWGHEKHDAVSDEVVSRVFKRVMNGMGLVVLHSGHFSKIFKK